MKIIKKNQLTILVLALMLVTAGYLNYNSNTKNSMQVASIGDATLVSSNITNSVTNTLENENINNLIVNNTSSNQQAKDTNQIASSIATQKENNEKTTETNAQISEYFSSSRLERDTMYSQMLESYQKILDSNTTSNKQKEAAQKEINKINKIKNSILVSENLIKTKGFKDAIIFVNDDSISVVINKEKLSKEDTAQVQSIIAREMNAKIDDIHIMNK